ncbi:MarR family transcriptional regulator [Pseudoxanthomonas sangjuensis]|uniref:MarR family winged helix-turn-helix transcriptional regulator n=1 Tax=Pseudoxanthomonas sangjuensis TaxID=1503750 RepID=UPI00139071AD|nr:MarR family transcriptional regulator [Pseudoxanthomonas sangjuensis]KAF1715443.1 MarR family transcriptional regulator [Pseudoxanthomonas sangjuensis]
MSTLTPLSSVCSGSTLGLLIRQVRDNMRTRWERELADAGHDLTFSQFVTIKKLADGIASVTELARIAEVNPGAMTRLLDKLEARGLIVRATDPSDRRALHIHLTDAGRAIWRDIDQCGQRVREAALAGLDDAQRRQFIHLLEQVRDNLSVPEA